MFANFKVLHNWALQFDNFYKVRRDSSQNQKVDPSMYLGSCGYAYALHRILKFLRFDALNSKEPPIFDIAEAQKMLDKAIEYN